MAAIVTCGIVWRRIGASKYSGRDGSPGAPDV